MSPAPGVGRSQLAADQRRALPHADQAEAGGALQRGGLLGLEAAAIVLDHQHRVMVAARQQHGDVARLRMLDDVVQRLLRDAIEVGLDIVGQPMSGGRSRLGGDPERRPQPCTRSRNDTASPRLSSVDGRSCEVRKSML